MRGEDQHGRRSERERGGEEEVQDDGGNEEWKTKTMKEEKKMSVLKIGDCGYGYRRGIWKVGDGRLEIGDEVNDQR